MTGPGPSKTTRRVVLGVLVVVLVAVAWTFKTIIEGVLSDGRVVDLGVLQLKLLYNSGVAFSMGATLPTAVVVLITGVITLVIAGYGWFAVPTLPKVGLVGLAAVLAGAITNLLNRAIDGAVADYFHTGWFATFNLPDTFITVGAVLIALSLIRPTPAPVTSKEGAS